MAASQSDLSWQPENGRGPNEKRSRPLLGYFRRPAVGWLQMACFFFWTFEPALRTGIVFADDPPPSQDTDGDGIPDAWESLYGLNPNHAADAFQDADGDRVPNFWEYLAQSNP